MCGIFGEAAEEVGQNDLRVMGAMLRHRGPDDRGLETWPAEGVALGHTRLAIIDLTEAGRNPMPNEDRTVWVTLNGEIYNHRELRTLLEGLGHVFRSHADTEVLVHAYEEWGEAHVTRLKGMFAYALYDRRSAGGERKRGRLLLFRDRLGIKPLYYYAGAGAG
jgi:asparagine synthase (glutamine-hydrolysing)